MKTVRSSINKNIKMILVVAAVTAVALGGLLLLISGNNERNQVPVDPTEIDETTEPTQDETTESAASTEGNTSEETEARRLFQAKVDKIEDSTAVAQLLETINLKKKIAAYMVELQIKEEPKSVNIRFSKKVVQKDKDVFNKEVQLYAEQILALIADAQQVQWTYTLVSDSGASEDVTVYLNEQQASELLGANVKQYGASLKAVEALLKLQKGN